ncbi:hypothetical protein BUALT_Bualt01G0079000 [Buddleja alternifolia]|uniref:Protein kinase domain-containing protein n=1 Tax=Buddleja alternifolia TaxID=168488 RepID=A0AAV6Y5C9_9LAMI|nr:hypothetical protein BUALT_Bualt01G0079000 [Buddleja alternifolia]
MSKIYDNWERLVAAVVRKEQLWELFHSDSIQTTSTLDSSCNFNSSISSSNYYPRHYDDLMMRPKNDHERTEFDLGFNNHDVFGCELSVLFTASDHEVFGKGYSVSSSSFRAEMGNGITIVVKRLRGVLERNSKKLDNPMDSAYFSYEDEKVIIYEYQSDQGSESTGKKFGNLISWKSRLRMAMGVAKAIALVHAKDNQKKLVHPNTEVSNYSSNSETDDNSSDLGLDNTLTTRFVIPTVGYRAPEVVYANNVSQASDVYSFGVVLLDLLTGRSPLNDIGVNTMNLVRWVTSMLHEKGTLVVFEFVPASNPNELIEMWKVLLVAMSCVVENPKKRPKSLDVVKMMEDIMSPLR